MLLFTDRFYNSSGEFFKLFDTMIKFSMPSPADIKNLVNMVFQQHNIKLSITNDLLAAASNFTHYEIIRICNDVIKSSVISNDKKLSPRDFVQRFDYWNKMKLDLLSW